MQNEATYEKVKTKVWGGVLLLFGFSAIISVLIRSLEDIGKLTPGEAKSFVDGLGVTTIFAMVIYAIVAKKFQFTKWKKILFISVLFLLMPICSNYLQSFYYSNVEIGSDFDLLFEGIRKINAGEKIQKIKNNSTKINELNEIISEAPEGAQQVAKYIEIINEIFELKEINYELVNSLYSSILSLTSKDGTQQNGNEVRKVLSREFGLNIDMLPRFLAQYEKLYNASKEDLKARKEYYQAFNNNESEQTQKYLLDKWGNLETLYLQEEATLGELQAQMKN